MYVDITKVILAAENGGAEVSKYFGQILDIQEKTTLSDFRTKADTESENAIIKTLSKEFPSFNILAEETGFVDKKSEYTFIVDPLDGSNNFVLGIPNFSISIGLMKNKESILGVVHVPVLGHTYHAKKNQGAYMQNKKISVNSKSDIKYATISYSCGYIHSNDYSEKLTHNLNLLGINRILYNWSPAFEFCLLASGKIEAIINNGNEIYDYAAGKIIAKEAGAIITSFDGVFEKTDEGNIFIASNSQEINKVLLKQV